VRLFISIYIILYDYTCRPGVPSKGLSYDQLFRVYLGVVFEGFRVFATVLTRLFYPLRLT